MGRMGVHLRFAAVMGSFVSAIACGVGERIVPTDEVDEQFTTVTLTENSDGMLELCNGSAECQAVENPNACFVLELTVNLETGETCQSCKNADGDELFAACNTDEAWCDTVTGPDPDCLICYFRDSFVFLSTCTPNGPLDDSFCGDGTCDADEDCSSCTSDCGACSNGDPGCDSVVASTTVTEPWTNLPLTAGGGTARLRLLARNSTANTDAGFGLSLGATDASSAWSALPVTVRFSENGHIQARDGGTYAPATAFPYQAGEWYEVELTIDFGTETYDLQVAPCGDAPVPLLSGAAFRAGAPSVAQVDNLAAWAVDTTLDLAEVEWEACTSCVPSCGDGTCGAGEDCTACAVDCGTCPSGGGSVYYVDPAAGQDSGVGTSSEPWKTLAEVAANKIGDPVTGGDVIILRSGYHGDVIISGHNTTAIQVQAESGATPRLSRLRFQDASGWEVRDLSVSPSHAPTFARNRMVEMDGASHHISFENSTLFTVADASRWAASDWNDKACNGVQVSGNDITVRGNHLKNINFGISVGGMRAQVIDNVIDSFSGDGLRGLGDDGLFEGNTIKNCYDVNDNHDDGFQSWSRTADGVGKGEVRGIVLRGNTFINYEDPNQPLRGPLQGIGCFDGMFVDWVVENNVIITDHWHGISFYGMKDSRVVNNTVIDRNQTSPGPPWIKITHHKNGTLSTNVLVRNNLATKITIDADQTTVTADHNITLSDVDAHFVDASNFDLRLRATSSAVDAGSSSQAPDTDHDGNPRPRGAAVDVGAYESY